MSDASEAGGAEDSSTPSSSQETREPGLVFIKLGGSLITDKQDSEVVRQEVLDRLAGEIAELARDRPGKLILGHGSGSFGHPAAKRWRIHEGISSPEQLPGIAATRRAAQKLHDIVLRALEDAGALPWTFAPSSALTTSAGRPVTVGIEPLLRALDLGLLPVVYGDVVMDRERGSAICSTETLVLALANELAAVGRPLGRALWLGETEGVWDSQGRTIERISATDAEAALAAAGGSEGVDITGGMRLRIETALELARRGTASWIGDGRDVGVVRRVLSGGSGVGTVVVSA